VATLYDLAPRDISPDQEDGDVFVVGTYDDDLYRVVLIAHIFCAIVGFGAVYLNALYGQEIRKRRGGEAAAIFDANFRVSGVGQYFIYAVFLLGLLLVALSDDVWEFSQTWVWLATALFLVALGLSHGVLQPALRRIRALMDEMTHAGPPPTAAPGAAPAGPPPQVAEITTLGKRVGVTGAVLDLVVIVMLVLMVFKPGAPGYGF
jgi:hypothetical protein